MKEERKKKRRRRYSQSFDLNETLSASNLSLDENNCTVGGLAGGWKETLGVLIYAITCMQDVPWVQHRRKKKLKRVREAKAFITALYNTTCSISVSTIIFITQSLCGRFNIKSNVRFMNWIMALHSSIMPYDVGLAGTLRRTFAPDGPSTCSSTRHVVWSESVTC